jgi:hypothetical protein
MVTVNVSLYVLITSPSHMANSGLRIHDTDPDAEEIKKGPAIKLTLSAWLRLLGSNQRQAD